MNSRKLILLSSFIFGLGLVLGVFILLGTSYLVVQAAPVDLFVRVDGFGTDCTQTSPCLLETAMEQSLEGDTIYIATGEYTGTGPSVITVTKSISLIGGWDGNPVGDININHVVYPTTLNGEAARRVVLITGDITPTLSGLQITHGYDGSQLGGGGIQSYNAHPEIIGCRIFDNTALYNAGIYLYKSDGAVLVESDIYSNSALSNLAGGIGIRDSSDILLSDNSIYSNTTPGSGGGVNIINSSQVIISRQEVFSNTSLSTSNGGGGIYLEAFQFDPKGDILILDSDIYGNHVDGRGGGIYAKQIVSLTLTSNNIYNHSAYHGGGVYATQVDGARFLENEILHNIADSNGGGLYMTSGGLVTISDNNIHDNQAVSVSGGGIYITHHESVDLDNNHIYSNTAYGTGGIHIQNTPGTSIGLNMVYSNTSTHLGGGGIYLNNTASAVFYENTIRNNKANLQGAGVGLLNCDGCIIHDNHIYNNDSLTADGGGVYVLSSDNITLSANHVYSNTAHGSGGGLILKESNNVEVRDNIFSDNAATRTNSQGGGIALSTTQAVTIAHNTISGNSVTGNGGGIGVAGSSDIHIIANQIHQNGSVDDNGGGLWFGSGNPVKMENNIVVGNLVPADKFGSGIYVFSTNLQLTHNTIADNTGGFEQGLYALGSVDPSKIWMTNNIFAYQNQGFVYGINSAITATHTLFYGNISNYIGSGSLTSTNELIGSPEFLDPSQNDYHIREGSAAIDNGLATPWLEVDIDGDPRPQGLGYDVGADELVLDYKVYLPLVIK
jgi:parallel beta-helix repeat protein